MVRESNPRQPDLRSGALPTELTWLTRPSVRTHVRNTRRRRPHRKTGQRAPLARPHQRRRWESNPLGPGCSRLPGRLAPASTVKCPRQGSNLILDLRGVACDPAHSEDNLAESREQDSALRHLSQASAPRSLPSASPLLQRPASNTGWRLSAAHCHTEPVVRQYPERESNPQTPGFKPSRSAGWRIWAKVVPDGVEPPSLGCRPSIFAVGPRDRRRVQWTHRESHPDLQLAELASSCWTMSPKDGRRFAQGTPPRT